MSTFYLYMGDKAKTKLMEFAGRHHDSVVPYALTPKFNGPHPNTWAEIQFRHSYVVIDAGNTGSHAWAFTLAQAICLRFEVDEVEYDKNTLTTKEFLELHPYAHRIEFHNRVLAVIPSGRAKIVPHHSGEVNRLNEFVQKTRERAAQLFG